MTMLRQMPLMLLIAGSILLAGCASFKRCADGTGDMLTSGSLVDTAMGVVSIPLVPVCTAAQAFAGMDESERQALIENVEQSAELIKQQQTAKLQHAEEIARRQAAEEAQREAARREEVARREAIASREEAARREAIASREEAARREAIASREEAARREVIASREEAARREAAARGQEAARREAAARNQEAARREAERRTRQQTIVAAQSVDFSVRGELVPVGNFNAFRVYLTNQSGVRGACRVHGTYEFVSDATSQMISTSDVLPAVLPPHGQARVDFARPDRNIRMKEWRATCEPL